MQEPCFFPKFFPWSSLIALRWFCFFMEKCALREGGFASTESDASSHHRCCLVTAIMLEFCFSVAMSLPQSCTLCSPGTYSIMSGFIAICWGSRTNVPSITRIMIQIIQTHPACPVQLARRDTLPLVGVAVAWRSVVFTFWQGGSTALLAATSSGTDGAGVTQT